MVRVSWVKSPVFSWPSSLSFNKGLLLSLFLGTVLILLLGVVEQHDRHLHHHDGHHLRATAASSSPAFHGRELQDEALNATAFFNVSDSDITSFCDANCPTPTENSWITAIPDFLQYIMIILLILMSALFSGLTLGLMGLDKTGLEIVMEGDDEVNAEAAKRIYPVRKQGNLLLCTLLLGNVAVNALLSILLADKAGGAVGFIISTFLIVIFGEILPQALCSRYALLIGSKTIPLVLVIRFILFPVAFPLAFILDKALGEELATTYSSAEMLKMLQIHVQEKVLDNDTAVTMRGALKYKDMTVSEVMTPLKNTYMLNVDERLNFETIASIFKTGYSRIPVYEVSKNNVIGLLFVKDLIFIDPEDTVPLRQFVQVFGRGVHVVWPVDKLGDVLRELRGGRSHMALVRDVVSVGDTDPYYEIKGIITLEDIVEEILGHEIVDETDAFVDGTHQVKVNREEGFEWAKLRLLGSKIVDEKLSYSESKAITAHMLANYSKAVSHMTEDQLLKLVSETVVSKFPTAEREIGKDLPDDLLYEKGVSSNVATLILNGKVTVISGADEFRADASSWTLLGINALRDPQFAPDFTAFVCNGPLRCLQFSRDNFVKALDASASQRDLMKKSSSSFGNVAPKQPQQNGSSAEPDPAVSTVPAKVVSKNSESEAATDQVEPEEE
ncbi:Metal transporter CNNM4 [Seminavis robusta]|uniref:Metal transporter CNNM4 n=1 Tax=Seminavis robusta TaxID=568900 RepID=A0A9N8DUH5_9STRA|nr:Metal transporter CNNM4 [Seminavis robusta]|eukprot:Sro381_g130770.1 Metal transporter CNNM4 (671) ;mRNA; f:16489-18709